MRKLINYRWQTALLSLLTAGFFTALLIESSQPPLPLLGELEGLDKLAHFLAFNVLGLLVFALSFKLNPKLSIPFFSMPFLIVTLSGVIEESYQMFVPGRAASILDFLADVLGAMCAILIANRLALLIRSINRIGSE
jgi:VanZ family protein